MTWSWFSFLVGAPIWGSIAVLLYGSASAVKAIRNRADEAPAPRKEHPAPVRTRSRLTPSPEGETLEPYLEITDGDEPAQIVR